MIDFGDLLKSVRFEMFERLSSPLFTTFLISWLLINYKIIFIFFGNSNLVVKLHILDNQFQHGYFCSNLFSDNFCLSIETIPIINYFVSNSFLDNLIMPALLTSIFIFLYPILSTPVYKLWRNNRNELIKVKMKADGEEPVSNERADQLLKRIIDAESNNQELITKNSELRISINEKNQNIDSLESELQKTSLSIKNVGEEKGLIKRAQEAAMEAQAHEAAMETTANNKEKQIKQEKKLAALAEEIKRLKSKDPKILQDEEFDKYLESGKLSDFILKKEIILTESSFDPRKVNGSDNAMAFGLLTQQGAYVKISKKGMAFFEWLILQE